MTEFSLTIRASRIVVIYILVTIMLVAGVTPQLM